MEKYTDEEVRNYKKVTLKKAQDYLKLTPNRDVIELPIDEKVYLLSTNRFIIFQKVAYFRSF